MTDLLRIPYQMLRPLYERTSFHRSVTEEVENKLLREAYVQCRSITRHHAKTFYMATRMLPNHKQRGIFAIYSLCRYIDHLVDEAEDLVTHRKLNAEVIRRKLDLWKQMLSDTYEGKRHDNPILLAFSDVLRNYAIPVEYPFELMDGVCMDLWKDRYETFEELYGYAYKVAAVVGLMTTKIFGYSSAKAFKYAESLGIAMQLTNILRDVGEDLRRGRIYLPAEDLERFGLEEKDLVCGRRDERFIRMIQFQINRTRNYYTEADLGIPLLSADSRLCVSLARHNYSRVLDKIKENNYDVFNHRAHLNYTEKLSILPHILYRTYFPVR